MLVSLNHNYWATPFHRAYCAMCNMTVVCWMSGHLVYTRVVGVSARARRVAYWGRVSGCRGCGCRQQGLGGPPPSPSSSIAAPSAAWWIKQQYSHLTRNNSNTRILRNFTTPLRTKITKCFDGPTRRESLELFTIKNNEPTHAVKERRNTREYLRVKGLKKC